MTNKSPISIKHFFQENCVPLIFALIVLVGIFLTKQTPLFIMNELIQGFVGNAFLVLALLIPVMAGMGFNFSIGVGAIAGQLGIIMVVNWGLSGFVGLLAAAALATPFAILFGILTGVVLNKARGYEMIASLFVGYVGNGIYQFVLLYLTGTVIPMTAGLLLTKGSGLKNSIELNHMMSHAIDRLLQVPFFFLLLVTGLIVLALSIYRIKKEPVNYNKIRGYVPIILSGAIIISALLMYMNVSGLKTVQFPLVTGIIIGLLAACQSLITRTKLGQAFAEVGLHQKNSNASERHISKVRITAIVISTVIASWGQIISLQNTGSLSTYTSHVSIALLAAFALIVGGASIRKATVTHALLGILLVQGFLIITPQWIETMVPISFASFQTIIFYSVFLYAFATSRSKKIHDGYDI